MPQTIDVRTEERLARERQRRGQRLARARAKKVRAEAWTALLAYKRKHPGCTCELERGKPLPRVSCTERFQGFVCPVLDKARRMGL